MIAAKLTVSRQHRGLKPLYTLTMGLEALCLAFAAIGGHLGLFGIFGRDLYLQHDFILLAILCTASGLQNATITSSSGATIRTTHLTGITTDLGIGLVEAFEYRDEPEKYLALNRKNGLRFGTIVGFIAGGAVGAALFLHFKYLGFLMPTGLAVYAAIYASRHRSSQLL
jgi:uncharacterized membrane protein YoaK (UPF0700 family)